MRFISRFTGTKPWSGRGKPLCRDRAVKGTGAGVETGSLSLYGLKPASLNFHPPPTSLPHQWVSKTFSLVSLFHTAPTQTFRKQSANLLMKWGNRQRIGCKTSTLPSKPVPFTSPQYWKAGKPTCLLPDQGFVGCTSTEAPFFNPLEQHDLHCWSRNSEFNEIT